LTGDRATPSGGAGPSPRLTTLGVGAQNSPRYRPAGLLVACGAVRVMIDGGSGAVPDGRLDAWLVTDERAELIAEIRRAAGAKGLRPHAATFRKGGVRVERRRVAHTSHPTWGYRIRARGRTIVWAPEFSRFPSWAAGADLMFAEGAAWDRPIRFAGGVGGHLNVTAIAREARRRGVKRLVFAHLGRPTLRALDLGARPPFGAPATDGQTFLVGRGRRVRSPRGRGRPSRTRPPRARGARARARR
jgi:Beta-lactamase superfamily domain